MKRIIFISLVLILFSMDIGSQVNHIGDLVIPNNGYLNANHTSLISFTITTDQTLPDIQDAADNFGVTLIFQNIHAVQSHDFQADEVKIRCLPVSIVGSKIHYDIFIPLIILSSGRYAIDIQVLDRSSQEVSMLSDFRETLPFITVGQAGFLNGAIHYKVNDLLAFDYSFLQSGSSLIDFPSQLGGIYTSGFCSDELISLSDLQIQVWQHKNIQESHLKLFYRFSEEEEFRSIELNDITVGATGQSLSEYYPDQTVIDEQVIEEYLYRLDFLTDDLLDNVGFEPGTYKLEIFFEFQADDIISRLPYSGNFTSAFTITDAPVGADCQAALLPIELLDFLVLNQDNQVYLKWISAIEVNNQYYFVERSQDVKNWESIFEVHGQGNSSDYAAYDYTDKYPSPGINYYRLKQKDFDGSLSYSKVKTVRIHDSSIQLYPNPVSKKMYYQIEDPDQKYYIKIFDQLGACVFDSTIPDPSNQFHELDLSYLTPGIYVIKYINADNLLSRTSKFVKK